MRPKFFLAGMKAQWNEGGWRVLLGDNTSTGSVMLRPVRVHITYTGGPSS
jgi:hypothetical protein